MKPRRTTRRYDSVLAVALLMPLVASGCMTYTGSRRTYMERMTSYVAPPSRPVIVIPGFGNSRLYDSVDQAPVWGLGKTLFQTRYRDDLDLPVDPSSGEFGRDRLVPDGGFAGYHAPFNIAFSLSSALRDYGNYADPRTSPDTAGAVYSFAYDWRLSATTNARLLGELIDSIRGQWPDPPRVDLVAHSAGGMIALSYLKLGGLGPDASTAEIDRASRAAASKVSSVTLLGVPQLGTNEAVRALARGDKLFRRELPPTMMASFPSIPEMLPAAGTVFIDESGEPVDLDIWDLSTWETLGFAVWDDDSTQELREAFAKSLARARRLRELLERPMPEGVRETAIAGDCVPTAKRILLRADRSLALYPSELSGSEAALGNLMFVPGDGSIEATSALGTGSSEQVFCAGHHGMASDPNVHRALLRVLLEPDSERAHEARAGAWSSGTTSLESPNTR